MIYIPATDSKLGNTLHRIINNTSRKYQCQWLYNVLGGFSQQTLKYLSFAPSEYRWASASLLLSQGTIIYITLAHSWTAPLDWSRTSLFDSFQLDDYT